MPRPKQLQKFGPLSSFDPEQFTKVIQGRGLWYRWSRAVTCPCQLNPDTSQWDPTCERCSGDGWAYISPYADQERHLDRDFAPIRAVFSRITDNPTVMEELGPWHHGHAQLTVQGETRVGFRDRFVGVEQEMAWSEVLVRGSGDEIEVGIGGRTTSEQLEAMRYEPVRINYVESEISGTRTIYYEGTDFKLNQPHGDGVNTMEWLPGKGPAAGARFVVHYDVHPVWIVNQGVYNIQNSKGPDAGLKGAAVLQHLPTTFQVALDYLTPGRS